MDPEHRAGDLLEVTIVISLVVSNPSSKARKGFATGQIFQMTEKEHVALVNFKDTSNQHWTTPFLEKCQVQYVSRLTRWLGHEEVVAVTQRRKRQERKKRQLDNLRTGGGDAAADASETTPGRMDMTDAERRQLRAAMATRSERTRSRSKEQSQG